MPEQVTLLINDTPTIVRMDNPSIVFQLQAINATPLTITNFFAYAGNTIAFALNVFESDGVTPLSLDNCTLNFYAVSAPNSTNYLFFKTSTGPDVVITNAFAGEANLYIRPTDTQNMISGTSFYCFVTLIPPTNDIFTLVEFLITLR